MYSTLSKLADRNFIIGFFLPALLGALTLLSVFGNVPAIGAIGKQIGSATSLTDLTYFVVGVWAAAIALQSLNYAFYRMLEGYTLPLKWIPWFRGAHVARYRSLMQKKQDLNDAWRQLGKDFPAARQSELESITRTLVTSYPGKESAILPSAFGNAIRAFEYYPADVYGADSITMWVRLRSVLSKEFGEMIDNARASVDLLVNIVFIADAFLVYFIVELLLAAAAHADRAWQSSLVGAGCALVVALVAYWGAVMSAVGWGETVKAAFDAYLNALADQLGFEIPKDLDGRRSFWRAFSQQAIYQLPLDNVKWRYK